MEDDTSDDIKLENHMGPKEAYNKFEKKLLDTLKSAADQPNFIALLKEKNVISDERTMRNLDMSSEAEGNRAIFILKEICESLPTSDTKFNNLLSAMEECEQDLKTLAKEIQIHLDPIGKDFDCEAMHDYLRHNSDSLSSLPYQQIDPHLIAYDVITYGEKTRIDQSTYVEHDRNYQMKSVLNEIRSSLFRKQPKKFKSFLEILEKSDDQNLQKIAKALGGSKRVPAIGQATAYKIVLIPVGNLEKIECDGKSGGSYLWKGHDFEITLPQDCADGTVNIALTAYLPSSTQDHCLASAVFQITTDVEQFKNPITLTFPHWVNIKSESDKEKLQFLVFHSSAYGNISCKLQKGSFKIGESSGSIEVSEVVLLISICKKFATASFEFSEAKDFHFHADQILESYHKVTSQALVNFEEGYTTKATGEATENKYLDLLFLPADGHDEKWGIYCIALDNPTYLQAVMKYFIDKNQINSGIKVFKRQVVFEPSSDAVADLLIVDTSVDSEIIKILHNKKISKQKIDSLDLQALKSQVLQSHIGYIIVERHEINFPTWCSLHIIGKLSPSSSKLKVDGLCGVRRESSEFSLAFPTQHGYKFETYEHVAEPVIKKIFKSMATTKINMQSTELSRALSCACRSVSDAWNLKRLDSMNLDGTGTVIAILDTAVDQECLPGKKIAHVPTDFACSDITVIDCLPNVPVVSTDHGTICSAVAVGLQCETESGVIPRGVAPGAKLVVYRIADQKGCYTDAILMALQHIQDVLEKNGIKIDVVSISYDCDENNEEAIRNKIEELTKMGITFVAAAGNRGLNQARACIPARFETVLSVGALDKHGEMAPYTPRVKIDVYAPGMFSADYKGTSSSANYEGTSYAAPAVAGLVLLLKQLANHVGSPAKDNINRVEILRKIFNENMFVKSDSTEELLDTLQPTVKKVSKILVFQPVDFLMSMKDNLEQLNDIVRKHLNQ